MGKTGGRLTIDQRLHAAYQHRRCWTRLGFPGAAVSGWTVEVLEKSRSASDFLNARITGEPRPLPTPRDETDRAHSCIYGGLTQAQQLRLDDRAQAPVRDDDTAVEIEVDGIRGVEIGNGRWLDGICEFPVLGGVAPERRLSYARIAVIPAGGLSLTESSLPSPSPETNGTAG
jgi:hypothetical protein